MSFNTQSNPELKQFITDVAKENGGIIIITDEIITLLEYDKLGGRKTTIQFIDSIKNNPIFIKTGYLILTVNNK